MKELRLSALLAPVVDPLENMCFPTGGGRLPFYAHQRLGIVDGKLCRNGGQYGNRPDMISRTAIPAQSEFLFRCYSEPIVSRPSTASAMAAKSIATLKSSALPVVSARTGTA